jgi:hypothetical protein
MNELSVKDKARIEIAVQRVDFDLDARVPRARRRAIREELRSNLTEAAKEVGAERAIGQLGDLGALARSYLEVYRSPWDLRAGVWATVVTYAVLQVLSFVIWFGFSAGLVAGGGHAGSYAFWSWFGPFGGSASASGFEITIGSPAHLVLMAIAFVIGSRYRQLIRR